MNKDLRKLLKPYLNQGCELVENKHYRLIFPNGRHVTISHTSSCQFYLKHVANDLRKAAK